MCNEAWAGGSSSLRGGCLRDYKGPVWVQKEDYKPDGTGFFDPPEETVRDYLFAMNMKMAISISPHPHDHRSS